jgi:hypothetical protein
LGGWRGRGLLVSVVDERAQELDRFSTALYTVREAARFLDLPDSTLSAWAHGYRNHPPGRREVVGAPILTTVPRRGPRWSVIPFIGLVEGAVLTAIRRSGTPMQRFALLRSSSIGRSACRTRWRAAGCIPTAEVLFDYAMTTEDPALVRAASELLVRNGQQVFNEVVAACLQLLGSDDQGYVRLTRLPAYEVAEVVVDSDWGFARPIFARGGARLDDGLGLFRAGEPLDGRRRVRHPRDHLEDAVRIATRAASDMALGHPRGLPELFLDRSLGRRQVPDLPHAVGLRLRTLGEVYGIPADETAARGSAAGYAVQTRRQPRRLPQLNAGGTRTGQVRLGRCPAVEDHGRCELKLDLHEVCNRGGRSTRPYRRSPRERWRKRRPSQ